MALTMANVRERVEVQRLVEEQAALRRVATLVARGVEPTEIFSAVSDEVAQLGSGSLRSIASGRLEQGGVVIVTTARPRTSSSSQTAP